MSLDAAPGGGPGTGLRRSVAAARRHAAASGYVGAWRLVRMLPERRARAVFRRVADRFYRRDGRAVRRLRANLARVVPEAELEQVTHAAVRSYLRYWCESFRLPAWPIEDLLARTDTVGEHYVHEAMAAGRGLVVPLPHNGNWDWAGAWACRTVAPLATVAEVLEPRRLYDEFVAYRRRLGMEILPLTGTDDTLPRLQEWLTGGGLVCLLADRDLSRTSVAATLLDEPVRMPRGPAELCLRTGAALVPVTLHYPDEQRMCLTFHPPVPHTDVATMTQGVADAFTAGIRAHPEDWHMMQRVFVRDLDPRPGAEH